MKGEECRYCLKHDIWYKSGTACIKCESEDDKTQNGKEVKAISAGHITDTRQVSVTGSMYKMRTVIKVRLAELKGRPAHTLWLECGHITLALWNRTHYVEGKTKSRCYECAKND